MTALRIFVSSPSDVRSERAIADRVIVRLGREFAYHLRIEPVMWEREPLVASRHFQEEITPPRETDIVVVILWSRLGVPLPVEKFPGPLSGKAVTGTEWEFEDALKATRERNLPDLLLYRKTTPVVGSLEDEVQVQQRLAQKRLVENFIKSWFVDQDAQSFTAAFREFDNAAAFEEMLETHLRELIKKRLRHSVEELEPAGIHWHQGSPFRGLLSFEAEHAQIFFGRTRACNELRELLVRRIEFGSAFVLVIGASGSGKSSLVKAGLLPELRLQGMVGRVAHVRHAVVRPSQGTDLVALLADAILSETALPELISLDCDRATLTELLRTAPAQAKLPIRQGLTAAGKAAQLTELGEARLLLVVDQLEEIFTLDRISEAEREAFVSVLQALAESGLVWVVATMRSDFFDRLETLPALLKLSAGEARYVIPPPEPQEIAQIVLQPAREAGLRFEVDTVRALPLDEVIRQTAARDPGSLPLLSFVLDQLWRRRTDRGVLTFEAYADLGGLEGALGRRAEEVFAALPAEVQAALPTLLRALVAIGRASGPTVCAKPASITQFPPGTPARTLIDAFLHPQARLLVADDTHIRVAHEALLSHWPRAREQVAADSRDLELLGRLENGAERWQAANIRHRDGLVLPKGLLLTEAVDLMRRWGTELPGAVLDFIKRSRSVAKRRRMRMALAMSGAIVLLPVIAAIVWTIMVWRGVQAVEGTMAFVQIPKGCFEMGAPLGEEGRFDHETPHNVCVSAFELGKYAITQDEWLQVMVESPDPARYKGGRNPIEMISWHDARSFTRRMNLFGKHQYRLPTEAEWEYAARAGTATTWFWGNKLEDGCGYANLRDLSYERERFNVGEAIIGCADGSVETAPVGSYKPNAFGLYDMTGNVFQWIEDCFGDYATAPANGSAAEASHCQSRVVRGGSWNSKPRFTRSASRDTYPPSNRNDVVGFRLAR